MAGDFVAIWNAAENLSQVCERTGKTRRQAISYAHYCRTKGQDLKHFPKLPASTALVGEPFGKWTVVEVLTSNRRICVCECGTLRVVAAKTLVKGDSTCCGCVRGKRPADPLRQRPEYKTWIGMRVRCTYPSTKCYPNYGGRGIKVCQRWEESYEAFFEDMGPKPSPEHTIDRIDNDGDYELGNCRWATWEEQANNKSTSRMLVADGRSQTLARWCRELGIDDATVATRLRAGWSDEEALFTPVDTTRRNRYARPM